MPYSRCGTIKNNRNISVEEQGRRFVINNASNIAVSQIQVDGCLYSNAPSCDWLFEINNPCQRVIFVELKGSNIERALTQIETTIAYYAQRNPNATRQAYIVSSRNRHPAVNSQVIRFRTKLAKNGISLVVKNSLISVNI